MGVDAWITVSVIGLAIGLMLVTRVAPDVILVAALTLLLVGGVLSPEQALSGLANEGLATVAVLYVVVAGLVNTGAVQVLGTRLLGRPRSIVTGQVRLMLPVAAASAFLNNTPVVAMLVPVIEDWAKRGRLPVSKFMLPLSYAAILGGTITLVGTSTNIVVNGLVVDSTDLGRMGFFEIGALGLPCAIAGIAFVLLTQKWLLPDRQPPLADMADAREYAIEMLVDASSPMIGKDLEQAGLRHLPGVFVAEIERDDLVLPAVAPTEKLRAGDRLLFVGAVDSVVDLVKQRGLVPAPDQLFKLAAPRPERRLFEVVVSDRCAVAGSTIREAAFRSRYNAVVLAVARDGKRLLGKIGDIELRAGDTLLIESSPSFRVQQGNSRDFLLVNELQDVTLPRHERSWVAVSILVAMVLVVASGLLSMLEAAMLAAGALIATRCTTASAARASVDWSVLIVIAASFGLGQAMQTSGASEAIAGTWIGLAGSDPRLALMGVFVITAVFTALVTNNAAAVLVFPIAAATASQLGVSLWPFVAVIMMGASASFATPIGYQTNLMVYGPGGYVFSDYLRMGLPLTLIVGVLAVVLAPLIWPF
jgi:di/tricarboxylate transporter